VKAALLAALRATAKAGKLKGFEEIKDVLLEEHHFAVDNDLLTPSFKLKRPQVRTVQALISLGPLCAVAVGHNL
jgi:long-chain acyl-CoA synthetase